MPTRAWLGTLLVAASVAIAGTVSLVEGTGCATLPNCNPHCNGNTKVSCESSVNGSGEPTGEDCGERRCVEDQTSFERYAVCAIGGRDARCNPEHDDAFCEGETIARCRGAYVEAREDCAARGLRCALRPFGPTTHSGMRVQ